ncbi:FAD-dependent oxidoreductase [Actinocorallia sp. A-T 12471]|uniref:FAD-dependent oxidoreductase n=1 Tax=Actinocorallia sp. A-T 12471 TaxID=3089813 RepID=UPI0029D2351E|nr:FAD-dependent oxidoreductase [Actinocorallia sp. A-T 12471]MDX6739641.1 FAD-dependent oxidoreductase [Actinocorallia sp. A-T 12471]
MTQAQTQAQTQNRARVVVVGSGVAGLTAAVSAAEVGAAVTVVERAPRADAGGNTRHTEAFLRMRSIDAVADDFEERLLGDFMGHPDPALLVESLKDPGTWSAPLRALSVADQQYVATLAENAGPTLRWIEGHGVRFAHLATPFLTTSTTRLMPVGGGLALVEALTDAAVQLGVDFHYETTARALLLEGGSVVGVATSRGETRGAVVLACGGYEGNAELMGRYHGRGGRHTRPVARGGHYNKGEGLLMALDAGAATAGDFALFHAEPVDPRSGVAEAAIFAFPYGILVNAEGRRFTDEAPGPIDAWYERIARRVHAQTDGVAYAIFDAGASEVPNLSAAIRTDQPPITAPTLDGLAAKLEIPAEALAATVAEFNASCGQGEYLPLELDGLATSGLTPPKSNWARPLDKGPYTAYPVIASNVFTFGGLKTDDAARVLDNDGRPLPGLYAAGELTGLYYTNYTGSTSVLRGAVYGRIAGRGAAGGA